MLDIVELVNISQCSPNCTFGASKTRGISRQQSEDQPLGGAEGELPEWMRPFVYREVVITVRTSPAPPLPPAPLNRAPGLDIWAA